MCPWCISSFASASFKSSSSIAFTLVVRKSTAVYKSRRTRPLANKRCATTWLNCADFVSGRGLSPFSYWTLNKFSVAGVGAFVVIFYRNFSNIFYVWRNWYLYLSLGWLVKSYTCNRDEEWVPGDVVSIGRLASEDVLVVWYHGLTVWPSICTYYSSVWLQV